MKHLWKLWARWKELGEELGQHLINMESSAGFVLMSMKCTGMGRLQSEFPGITEALAEKHELQLAKNLSSFQYCMKEIDFAVEDLAALLQRYYTGPVAVERRISGGLSDAEFLMYLKEIRLMIMRDFELRRAIASEIAVLCSGKQYIEIEPIVNRWNSISVVDFELVDTFFSLASLDPKR